MKFQDPFFAVLDFGTGGGKCAIFDAEGHRVADARRTWGYHTVPYEHSELTAGFGFDPHAFWASLCACAREALQKSELPSGAIAAIGTTAQRLGTIFLDAHGREIYAAPNMDGRGLGGAFAVIEKLGMERTIEITGKDSRNPFFCQRLSGNFSLAFPERWKRCGAVPAKTPLGITGRLPVSDQEKFCSWHCK